MLREVESATETSQNELAAAENNPQSQNNVGANMGALSLKDPRRLYRFSDVGVVAMFNKAEKVKVTATFEVDGIMKTTTITLPGGNWIFAGVGAMGIENKGYLSFDNPYAGQSNVGAIVGAKDG